MQNNQDFYKVNFENFCKKKFKLKKKTFPLFFQNMNNRALNLPDFRNFSRFVSNLFWIRKNFHQAFFLTKKISEFSERKIKKWNKEISKKSFQKIVKKILFSLIFLGLLIFELDFLTLHSFFPKNYKITQFSIFSTQAEWEEDPLSEY